MRLQLHAGFTFADAAHLVPYLADLGVSHLYSSPILTARAGSMHGYDVVDPTRVNPELGGEAGLRDLVATLRAAGLGLIVDIVPNHMAVGGSDNEWWLDVLRHGPASRYAGYFDIDWNPADPGLHNKLLAPFLGQPYGEALRAGDLQLAQDATGAPVIRYYNDTYPVAPRDHAEIATLGHAAYSPATEDGRARLHRLLERQNYRLAWWGTAGDEINWRRFFDINGLAGLRIEQPEVFEATHATLFRLYAEGLIDGMRVDHVDGLTDPPSYCRRLRARLEALTAERPSGAPAARPYIVVEKILGSGEAMPTDWGVDGTSGYDFMNLVSAVQHDQEAERSLAFFWSAVSSRPADFPIEEALARRQIMERGFDAQLEATAAALHRLARLDPLTRDTTQPAIRRALLALLTHFPVYRTYDAGTARSAGDQAAFAHALEAAKADSPLSLHPVLDRIDRWLGGEDPGKPGAALRQATARRFQQLSAPIAAKAVEDTAFYRYGRLLSRNDVGFDAARLGAEPAEFHAANADRREKFPDTLLATATHDHKRGEDLRARLAVLTEIPDAWQAAVQRWMEANAAHRRPAGPSPGDEAQLYQMIVGGWPTTLSADDAEGCKAFAERLAGWQQKAIREAKLQGDWTGPDEAYEAAARDFLFSLLAPGSRFASEAAGFVRRIAPAGAVNGLAQTLLKLTAPGVPDFFQGTEFWDFSLVDPDNRRPVDFAARIAGLRTDASPSMLAATWRDGRVKQAVIARTLALRRAAPELFARGDCRPLDATGALARHVLAFMRVRGDDTSLTVVPRLPHILLGGRDAVAIPPDAWRDTVLHCPTELVGRRLHDTFGGRTGLTLTARLPVGALLRDCPVSLRCTVEMG
ncbi:MAG TPA: malto-oligosyltrehalose synthase [Acetobacteraceae bacterium]|jgi:malto-oligosyltrehalose synthase